MKPELHIFGITIPTFGLMVSIGVLCFALIILTLFRKNHISEKKIDKLIIVCGLAGAIFALSAVSLMLYGTIFLPIKKQVVLIGNGGVLLFLEVFLVVFYHTSLFITL